MISSKELATGILLVSFSLTVLLLLIPFGIVEPKKVQYAALSPSHYPRLIAIVLAIFGAAIAVRGFLTKATAHASDLRMDAGRRILLMFFLLGLYALILQPLGFIIASALALCCLLWLAGERRFWLILMLAIIVPTGLYVFFVKVARIPIPTGILKSLLAWF